MPANYGTEFFFVSENTSLKSVNKFSHGHCIKLLIGDIIKHALYCRFILIRHLT